MGFLFGLVAPVVGLFAGLQFSVPVGNVLSFPLIFISILTGQPFGDWSGLLIGTGFLFSGMVWALLFVILSKLLHRS